MKKYKCKNCGYVFEGDLSTTECPKCNSDNIGIGSKALKIPKIFIYSAIALIFILVLLNIGDKHIEIRIDQFKSEGYVNLTIQNFKTEYTSNLIVEIERDGAPYATKPITSETMRIDLPTGCYIFSSTFSDGRKNPKIIQFGPTICFERDTVEVKPPPIILNIIEKDSCLTKKWHVVISAKSKATPLEYSVDNGKTFSQSNKHILSPGIYDIVVKDANGLTTTQQKILGTIHCPDKPVTLADVQAWLDKLATGDQTARADFTKYFNNDAKAVGMENVDTAFQLMVEIIANQQQVKINNIKLNGTRISSITIELNN